MRISVVIPARNEERRLPRLLDTVDAARGVYDGTVEVIVSDNCSDDGTAALAAGRGCILAATPVRCIAAVRNAGAAAASGEVLVFVDADIRIHPGTFGAVRDAMRSNRFVGGATGVVLPRMSLGLAATYAVLYPMILALTMDTGPTFCARSDFVAIGGYDEACRYAEDVDFLLRLKRHGRRTGRRLVRLTRARAIADLRKFDMYGDWHYFPLIPQLLRWQLSGRRMTIPGFEREWYGMHREDPAGSSTTEHPPEV